MGSKKYELNISAYQPGNSTSKFFIAIDTQLPNLIILCRSDDLYLFRKQTCAVQYYVLRVTISKRKLFLCKHYMAILTCKPNHGSSRNCLTSNITAKKNYISLSFSIAFWENLRCFIGLVLLTILSIRTLSKALV